MPSDADPRSEALAASIAELRRRVDRLERYLAAPYPAADPEVLLGPLDPPPAAADRRAPPPPLDPRD